MSAEEFAPDLSEVVLARARTLGIAQELFRLLTSQAPVGIFVASAQGSFEYVNARWCALSGLEAERALGESWKAAVHPDDLEQLLGSLAADYESICSYRFRLPDGTVRLVESRTTPLRGDDGGVLGRIGMCVEPTVPAPREPSAPEAKRFRLAFEHASIGTGIVDLAGNWLEVNSAFCALLGYSEEELLRLNLADLGVPGNAALELASSGQTRAERRYRRADGATLWVEVSISLVPDVDGEPLCYVVQAEDIAERKQTERELRLLADHDALTGLLNRRGFMDGLQRELRRMDRRGEYGALLVLDLDNFKRVNDTAGHMAGDQVLRTTADVLRRRLRATDVIGRLGGDEFAALVLNVTPRQAREIADETTEALRALTVSVGAQTIKIAASIGVVAVDEMGTESGDDLLAAADRAMYRIKSLRRNR